MSKTFYAEVRTSGIFSKRVVVPVKGTSSRLKAAQVVQWEFDQDPQRWYGCTFRII